MKQHEKAPQSEASSSPTCSIAGDDALDAAQDALTRMKRASDRGTGCHLTAEMINGLRVTLIGAMWEEEDPRQ